MSQTAAGVGQGFNWFKSHQTHWVLKAVGKWDYSVTPSSCADRAMGSDVAQHLVSFILSSKREN